MYPQLHMFRQVLTCDIPVQMCYYCEKKCNLRQPSRHSQLWKVGFYSVEIVLLNYQFVSLSPCQIVESLSNRREKLSILAKIFCDAKTKEWADLQPCCGHLISSCLGAKRRADLNLLQIWKDKLNLMTASLPDDCLVVTRNKKLKHPRCFHCLESLPNPQQRW